jgi:hypothetical protein
VAQLTYGDPDGYGRHGILQEGPAGFVCHECGRDDIAHLGLHAYRAHGITAAEYRAGTACNAAPDSSPQPSTTPSAPTRSHA